MIIQAPGEKPKVTDNKTEQQPSFEQTLAELETLVEQLESGKLELADSLEKFKRGIELSRQCRVMLDKAQQTVDEVMDSEPQNPGGNGGSSET
ncbi:MAG: exodeoxyribonuclease VII small subunit [Wenzhouxiangellaceae bacterium]|nr:exodeoxyribonuclease VII small subunit [Wenzhouxiangellaceae bacterium]MBS3746127.1 exodeoxyribonuclease VII small subunit [Wenzhouxiangellaceae bacterium]